MTALLCAAALTFTLVLLALVDCEVNAVRDGDHSAATGLVLIALWIGVAGVTLAGMTR